MSNNSVTLHPEIVDTAGELTQISLYRVTYEEDLERGDRDDA